MQANYKLFENQLAINAIGHISGHASPAWLKVRKARFLNKLTEELHVYEKHKNEIQEKYVELDKYGQFVIKNPKTGEYLFKSAEDRNKCIEEVGKLQEIEFELPEMRHSWIKDIKIPDGSFGAIMHLITLDVEEIEPKDEVGE